MNLNMKVVVAAACLASIAQAASAGDAALAAGVYEVTYRLDLPHLENREEKVVTVCLKNAGAADGVTFPVLSSNNPLSSCPVRNLKREGDDFSFDIVCAGGNSAKAKGAFSLGADRFQGAIAMTMGGKNMTMTEVQRGARVGDCPQSAGTAATQ